MCLLPAANFAPPSDSKAIHLHGGTVVGRATERWGGARVVVVGVLLTEEAAPGRRAFAVLILKNKELACETMRFALWARPNVGWVHLNPR
jgi:hypothetical protein